MTSIQVQSGEPILLEVIEPRDFRRRCPEQFDALVECAEVVIERWTGSDAPSTTGSTFQPCIGQHRWEEPSCNMAA